MSQNDMVIANQTFPATRSDLNSAFQALASTSKGSTPPSTVYGGQHWIEDDSPSGSVWTEKVYDGADHIPVSRIDTTNNRVIPYNAAHGRCRLTKSGNLLLSPYNGNVLTINGAPEVVPNGGISLGAGGLSDNTVYYIYAYMNSGTMTLEASTTTHATDTSTGVEIKSGDATRTLVGMARTIAGPAWADSANQRLVLSWFNRRAIATGAAFSTNRSRTSTTYGELHSEIRNEFLTWGDEAVQFAATGRVDVNLANEGFQATIALDSTTTGGDAWNYQAIYGNNAAASLSLSYVGSHTEGYHYATLLGAATGTATATFIGSATPAARCALAGIVRG